MAFIFSFFLMKEGTIMLLSHQLSYISCLATLPLNEATKRELSNQAQETLP